MHFLIVDKLTGETNDRKDRALWRLIAWSYIKPALWMFSIGAVLILISIVAKFTLDSLGLAVIIVACMNLLAMRAAKKEFINRKARLNESWQKEPEGTIEIDSSMVKTSYKNMKHEIAWSMFTGYMFRRDILLLLISDSCLSTVAIDRNQLNAEDFERLFVLVKSKIPERKLTFF
jgi:hypothetical protein